MKHTPLFLRHALAVTTIACFAATAAPVTAADEAQVSVLNGWRMDTGHHMAALRISLADGWHTYWRAPGDAGIPPRFDWSASKNVSGVQVHWPTPDVYAQNDMRYVGYEGEVVLPLEIRPTESGEIHLEGVIEFGVCDDICIPMTAQLRLDLDGTAPQSDYPAITASLNDAPTRITDAKCDTAPIEDGLKVTVTLGVPSLGAREIAVIEHPDAAIWVSEAMTMRKDTSTLTAVSELVPPHAKPFMINRSDLTITVIGNGTAYEARGCTGR